MTTNRKNISPCSSSSTFNSTMSKLLSAFTFPEKGMKIRAVNQDGEPWFIAKDVCEILGFSDTNAGTRHLDDDEKMTVNLTGISPTNPMVTLISEPGLYTLILKSRKPEAKPFKKWVTKAVLPSIRKHGGYFDGQESLQNELVACLHRTIQENALPALRYYDKLADSCHRSIGRSSSSKSMEWKQEAIKIAANEFDIPVSWMNKIAGGGINEVLAAVKGGY